jgi:uncharacterized protein (TIGR03067 family)
MFTAFVALALTAPVDSPKENEKPLSEAAQKEVKKLDGKWKVVKNVVNGEEQSTEVNKYLTFTGRKLAVDDKEAAEITALDPSTDPKCIDLKITLDDTGIAKGTVFEGIYKLDGDDLQLAIHIGSDKKRPDKFESANNSSIVLVTLKREKK